MNSNYEETRFFIQDATEGWEVSEQADKEMFKKAYELAKKVHNGQYRDEGTPYITHIDGVLAIFKEELNDYNYYKWTIIALHDVLEDSNYTYEELKNMFNELIANEVRILTKTKGISLELYLSNMEAYEYAPTIIKIKLADRLHNVRSLKNIINTNRDKIYKYIRETEKYYLPLAEKYNQFIYEKLIEELSGLKGECKNA